MFRNPHMETMSLHYTTSSCDQDMTRCPLQKTYDFFFSKSQFCGGKSNCKIFFSCKIVKLSFKKNKDQNIFCSGSQEEIFPKLWMTCYVSVLSYLFPLHLISTAARTQECCNCWMQKNAVDIKGWGSWGKVEAGGLWVGTLWDWLSISSCRHYQLAKIGNLFKLLFSHMCTLQNIWISFYYLHFHSRATLSTDTQAVWVRNRHPVKGFSRWKWKHWK